MRYIYISLLFINSVLSQFTLDFPLMIVFLIHEIISLETKKIDKRKRFMISGLFFWYILLCSPLSEYFLAIRKTFLNNNIYTHTHIYIYINKDFAYGTEFYNSFKKTISIDCDEN